MPCSNSTWRPYAASVLFRGSACVRSLHSFSQGGAAGNASAVEVLVTGAVTASSLPLALVYSRFRFLDAAPAPLAFRAVRSDAASRIVVSRQVRLRGDEERVRAPDDALGLVSFEGFEFRE